MSRELDAEIAVKVIGVKLCYHELDDNGYVCKHCHLNKSFWWPKWGRISPPEHYSTDLNAAWNVLEKLMSDGIGLPEVLHDGQLWVASIRNFWKSNMIASAHTAPEAICLVALKAIKEKGVL